MDFVRRLNLSQNFPWLFDFYWQSRFLLTIFHERFLMNQTAAANHSHDSHEWDFTTPDELDRYQRVLTLVRNSRGPAGFDRILEIGCGQGLFTDLLAPCADAVVGMDISGSACELAKQRCAGHPNVTIRLDNLFTARLAGPYSLILAMCVLQYVHGKDQHAQLAARLHQALAPGGLLLINEVRLPQRYEHSWWANALVEGGVQYAGFLERWPGFRCVYREYLENYVIVLFEKVPESSRIAGSGAPGINSPRAET